jgi:(2R)-3-sulfolactate dehydrogenase (NADP+)
MGKGYSQSFEDKKKKIEIELVSNGLPLEQAELVADCFATADLYGVTSHGAAVLPAHLQRIKQGGYNLAPVFNTIHETPSFAVIDGDNAMGPVSADYCMKYAVNKCKESGMFTVFSRNNNTFGPAFYYPLKAAEDGFLGIIFSNSPAQMAPCGGKEKMLGTNPFSAVIPVPGKEPIIIDMSTSITAKSRILEYQKLGKQLPDGWATDENGRPTNDPDEALRGLVLPMAGFKGTGLSMLFDIVAGALSGAAYLNNVGRFYGDGCECMNVGYCLAAIDPRIVLGASYGDVINNYVTSLRNCQTVEGEKIILPGDDRSQTKNRNLSSESDTLR